MYKMGEQSCEMRIACSTKPCAAIELTVECFQSYREFVNPIVSPKVYVRDCGIPSDAAWYMSLWPLDPRSCPYAMGAYVGIENCKTQRILADCKISVLMPRMKKWERLVSSESKLFDSENRTDGNANALMHAKLFARDSPYLSESGSLTVKSEIQFVEKFVRAKHANGASGNQCKAVEIKSWTKPTIGPDILPHVAAHLLQLRELYQDKQGADLIIVSSDGQKFPVHRAILRAYPAVFAAIAKRRSSGEWTIPDVDGKTMDALLRYLYSCDMSGMENVAESLLDAADKYHLLDLRNFVIDHVAKMITAENVCRFLVIADRRGWKVLGKAALSFIAKNVEQVVEAGHINEIIHDANGTALICNILLALKFNVQGETAEKQ